ncbi:MAG: hypothetical protein WCS51_03080 [Bacilli bacterium]|jgi:predicted tellurium resistance membrane protein TerC
MSLYYITLGLLKLYAFLVKKNKNYSLLKQFKANRNIDYLLFLLIIIIGFSIYVSIVYGINTKHIDINMITIAAYTFYKVIIAIINLTKAKKNNETSMYVFRSINIIDALVSLFNLELSMFACFGTNKESYSQHLTNIIAGFCLSLILIGISITIIVISTKKIKAFAKNIQN